MQVTEAIAPDYKAIYKTLPPHLKVKVKLEKQKRLAQAIPPKDVSLDSKFAPYRFDPAAYAKDFYGAELWSKQIEILDACVLAVRQQIEKRDYELNILQRSELKYWQPGQRIKKWIMIDAGHTVGKTFVLGIIGKWFFDCFAPSVSLCVSSSIKHASGALFKELKRGRIGRADLRGTTYPVQNKLWYSSNHYIENFAINDNLGGGSEKVQGQHEDNQLFLLDETEAMPEYIFDAIETMIHGNIALVVGARNPRTNNCTAHTIRDRPDCEAITISCLEHPNVIEGRTVIPASVARSFIESMAEEHCNIVYAHDIKTRTFEIPWETTGTIYEPKGKYLWRVLGIVPDNLAGDTFCSVAVYEYAEKQNPPPDADKSFAYIGVDVARGGNDNGAIYQNYGQTLKKIGYIDEADGYPYYIMVRDACKALKGLGVERLEVRVDGGGGYGSTCIDNLKRDIDLRDLLKPLSIGTIFDGVECVCIRCGLSEWQVLNNQEAVCTGCENKREYKPGFKVIEVLNNEPAPHPKEYANFVTEMYANAGKALELISIIDGNKELKYELTRRKYIPVIKTVRGYKRDVKELVSKKIFKKERGNISPDDGDGAVLALAPSSFFRGRPEIAGSGDSRQNRQRNESREQQKRGLQRGGIQGRGGFTSRDNGRRW